MVFQPLLLPAKRRVKIKRLNAVYPIFVISTARFTNSNGIIQR